MSHELSQNITSSETVIGVLTFLNQTEFPIPGIIQIGTEKIRYNNLSSKEFLDCVRGYDSTTAAAHVQTDDVVFVEAVPAVISDVTSVKAEGEAEITGDVTLSAGTNVTLTQTGSEIEIAATDSATSIQADANPALTGAVTLSSGTNITLTQVGQDIEIAAAGGGVTYPLLADDGTAAAPSYSFSSETGKGLFGTDGEISIAIDSVQIGGVYYGDTPSNEIAGLYFQTPSGYASFDIKEADGTSLTIETDLASLDLKSPTGVNFYHGATRVSRAVSMGVENRVQVINPAETASLLLSMYNSGKAKVENASGNLGVGITGTATDDDAEVGEVGEYVQSVVSTSTNTPPNGEYGDLTSITLSAGDWDVRGLINVANNASTFSSVNLQASITEHSGNTGAGLITGYNYTLQDGVLPTSFGWSSLMVPTHRVKVAITVTLYLKLYIDNYSAGNPIMNGSISARRVR